MPDQFKHYWPLTEAEKNEVWQKGTIILDTNVWLSLYRLPEKEREMLFAALKHKSIKPRLWVPHQVAEEFFRNRLSNIREQIASADKLVAEITSDIEKAIDKYVRQHHPLIDREKWKKAFRTTADSLKQEYEQCRENNPVSWQNDPLLPRIKEIMSGRIGEPFSAEQLKEARKEAAARFEAKVPPGYKDQTKKGDDAFGDYFIWKQVLLAMEAKKTHVVFVTDDVKEDWWLKQDGERLGPASVLRREFREAAHHETDFTSSVRFMEWASKITSRPFGDDSKEAFEEARKGISADHLANLLRCESAKVVKRRSDSRKMAHWALKQLPRRTIEVSHDDYDEWFKVLQVQFPDANEKTLVRAVHNLVKMIVLRNDWYEKKRWQKSTESF